MTRHRPRRSVSSPLPCQPRKYHERPHRCVGKCGRGGSRSPCNRDGQHPCPSTPRSVPTGSAKTSSKHRGRELRVQRASKAPALSPSSPRVRDCAEFRAEAERATIGLAQRKPRCCRSFQRCKLAAFPPRVAAPRSASPQPTGHLPSKNKQGRNTDCGAGQEGKHPARRAALGAARAARRAHGSRQLSR